MEIKEETGKERKVEAVVSLPKLSSSWSLDGNEMSPDVRLPAGDWRFCPGGRVHAVCLQLVLVLRQGLMPLPCLRAGLPLGRVTLEERQQEEASADQ